MKNFFLLCICGLFAYCHFQAPAPKPVMRTTPPVHTSQPGVLNIVVNDVSKSDAYLSLHKNHILELLLQDSSKVEALQLAGILINEKGLQQTLFLSSEIRPSRRPVTGDLYEEAEAKTFNREADLLFRGACQSVVNSFASQILLPRTSLYSDVEGAMTLAFQLSTLPAYRNWEIRIIVVSDLLQDVANRHTLGSFQFPDNATIYTIGCSDNQLLSRVFPHNRVIPLPVFQPAFFQIS